MSAHPSAEQLSAFLDLELPDGVRLSIEEHLGACDACAGHLAELASVDEAARSLPFQEPVGYFDDFASRVRGRLAVRPARRTLPVWSWAAAAAVLLAVVTPLALRERSAQAPAAAILQKEASPMAADAAPPAMASKPQAPPAGAGARASEGADRGFMDANRRRASEAERQDRLERRDRPAEDALEFRSRLSRDKTEAAAEPPRPAATAPPARLEEQTAEKLKSLGYAAPPLASGQRPHGPHPQQYAPPPAAPAPAEESLALSAPVVDETLDRVRDTDVAQEEEDRFAREKRSPAPRPQAAPAGGIAGGAAAETKLDAGSSLKKSVPAPTGDDARRRREAFRRMAREHPAGASADAARVGTIEEGVRAYRLDGRPEDRAIAERDGRAYLARPDALQAPRVRALLRELEAIR
jgi:hypothetical protein